MANEVRRFADEPTRDAALLVVGLFIEVLAIVKPFTTAILFEATLATAARPIRMPDALLQLDRVRRGRCRLVRG